MPVLRMRINPCSAAVFLWLAGCAASAPERGAGAGLSDNSAALPESAPWPLAGASGSVGGDDRKVLVLDLGGGVRMDLLEIPAGELCVRPSPARTRSKLPEHRVVLAAPFYISRCEVTQQQWVAVMGDNPSWYPDDRLPVHRVDWVDCRDFCAQLARRIGRPARLPSEAEWEYACRAGTSSLYSFGEDPAPLDQYAWCATTSGRKPNPVAQKLPNPWGLYDMHGNVWEWCEDLYFPDERAMPADGGAVNEGEASGRRVLRGGSWFNRPEDVGSGSRLGRPAHLRSAYIGFRVVVPTRP